MSKATAKLLYRDGWLYEQYVVQQKGLKDIGDEVGVVEGTVLRAMRKLGIPSRSLQDARKVSKKIRQRNYPELGDGDWLHQKYVVEMLTQNQIANILGCNSGAVLKAMRQHGIKPRTPGALRAGRYRKDRNPLLHDREFLYQRYIVENKTAAEIAKEIDVTFYTLTAYLHRFGIRKVHEELFVAKDGTQQRKKLKGRGGYVLVWKPDHPSADSKGYVKEHRLVAEQVLGRHLNREEVVHHVNENRADNRVENLMVFSSHRLHMAFHHNPPDWIPRCECCGKPRPEVIKGRPDNVPFYYDG